MPEANVSGVTQKINELISELDPGGVIDAIEVKSFENMLTETVQDWDKFREGQGTLVEIMTFPDGSLRFLVDFSSRRADFGIGANGFFGKASNGELINTIRVTLTKDLKVYNAFSSKSLNGTI